MNEKPIFTTIYNNKLSREKNYVKDKSSICINTLENKTQPNPLVVQIQLINILVIIIHITTYIK